MTKPADTSPKNVTKTPTTAPGSTVVSDKLADYLKRLDAEIADGQAKNVS